MRDLSAIRDLVLRRFAPRGTKSIEPATSLVKSGWIDSFGIVELVAFLESEYGTPLPDAEVVPENFESLVAIEKLLDRIGAR